MFARYVSIALSICLGSGVVAQAVDVPSGRDIALYDVILEEGPAVARFRFLVPGIGGDAPVTFSETVDDFQYLCDALVIPGLAANGWDAKDVVISMSAAEVPFGVADEGVTQYFQPFTITDKTCIWEDF